MEKKVGNEAAALVPRPKETQKRKRMKNVQPSSLDECLREQEHILGVMMEDEGPTLAVDEGGSVAHKVAATVEGRRQPLSKLTETVFAAIGDPEQFSTASVRNLILQYAIRKPCGDGTEQEHLAADTHEDTTPRFLWRWEVLDLSSLKSQKHAVTEARNRSQLVKKRLIALSGAMTLFKAANKEAAGAMLKGTLDLGRIDHNISLKRAKRQENQNGSAQNAEGAPTEGQVVDLSADPAGKGNSCLSTKEAAKAAEKRKKKEQQEEIKAQKAVEKAAMKAEKEAAALAKAEEKASLKRAKEAEKEAEKERKNAEKMAKEAETKRQEEKEKKRLDKSRAVMANFFQKVATPCKTNAQADAAAASRNVEASIKLDQSKMEVEKVITGYAQGTTYDDAMLTTELESWYQRFSRGTKRRRQERASWQHRRLGPRCNLDGSERPSCSRLAPTYRNRRHLYQFSENTRPPYYGTMRRESKAIKGSRPFAHDISLDYEVDSEEEWEEEEPGENCEDSDGEEDEEEKGGAENEEEEDGFMVPDGYLSDDELRAVAMDPEGGGGGDDDQLPSLSALGGENVDPREAAATRIMYKLDIAVEKCRSKNKALILCANDPKGGPDTDTFLQVFSVDVLDPGAITRAVRECFEGPPPPVEKEKGHQAKRNEVPESLMPTLLRSLLSSTLSLAEFAESFVKEHDTYKLGKKRLKVLVKSLKVGKKLKDKHWRVDEEVLKKYGIDPPPEEKEITPVKRKRITPEKAPKMTIGREQPPSSSKTPPPPPALEKMTHAHAMDAVAKTVVKVAENDEVNVAITPIPFTLPLPAGTSKTVSAKASPTPLNVKSALKRAKHATDEKPAVVNTLDRFFGVASAKKKKSVQVGEQEKGMKEPVQRKITPIVIE